MKRPHPFFLFTTTVFWNPLVDNFNSILLRRLSLISLGSSILRFTMKDTICSCCFCETCLTLFYNFVTCPAFGITRIPFSSTIFLKTNCVCLNKFFGHVNFQWLSLFFKFGNIWRSIVTIRCSDNITHISYVTFTFIILCMTKIPSC